MNCARGDAPTIISQALALGIMARPVGSVRVGVGEGLYVSKTGFMLSSSTTGRSILPFNPEPQELLMDWELTTRDLLDEEHRKSTETPW